MKIPKYIPDGYVSFEQVIKKMEYRLVSLIEFQSAVYTKLYDVVHQYYILNERLITDESLSALTIEQKLHWFSDLTFYDKPISDESLSALPVNQRKRLFSDLVTTAYVDRQKKQENDVLSPTEMTEFCKALEIQRKMSKSAYYTVLILRGSFESDQHKSAEAINQIRHALCQGVIKARIPKYKRTKFEVVTDTYWFSDYDVEKAFETDQVTDPQNQKKLVNAYITSIDLSRFIEQYNEFFTPILNWEEIQHSKPEPSNKEDKTALASAGRPSYKKELAKIAYQIAYPNRHGDTNMGVVHNQVETKIGNAIEKINAGEIEVDHWIKKKIEQLNPENGIEFSQDTLKRAIDEINQTS